MFNEVMLKIKDFLDGKQKDAYEFSIWLEDILVDDYDVMFKEQPKATYALGQEVPDICATVEPGMTLSEVVEFKRLLKIEYNKALVLVI